MVSAILSSEALRGIAQRTRRNFFVSLLLALVLHALLAAALLRLNPFVAAEDPFAETPRIIQAALLPAASEPVAAPQPAKVEPVAKRETRKVEAPKPQPVKKQPAPAASREIEEEPVLSTTAAAPSAMPVFDEPVVQAHAPLVPREPIYTPPSSEVAYHHNHNHNPKPNYPLAAKRRGMEGVVELRVQVDNEGKPSKIEIASSSGFDVLDREALKAVQQWRFEPARRDGVALAGEVIVPLRFRLDS